MASREATGASRADRLQRGLLPLLAIGSGIVLLLVGVTLRSTGEEPLIGTALNGNPAPDFTLTDYRGEQVSLSDFRGTVVALTFIYTDCPDVCPATAGNLRAAYEQLPEETREAVTLVAITVDPERDTAEALQAFSRQHGLADNPHWYALHGEATTLERVWQAYGIYPGTTATSSAHEHSANASSTALVPGGGEGHTDAIYLVDPEGR